LTNWLAKVNAPVKDDASLLPDPTAMYDAMYGANALTAATVVISFTTIGVCQFNDAHGPSAVMSAIFPFTVPGIGSPPVAIK